MIQTVSVAGGPGKQYLHTSGGRPRVALHPRVALQMKEAMCNGGVQKLDQDVNTTVFRYAVKTYFSAGNGKMHKGAS